MSPAEFRSRKFRGYRPDPLEPYVVQPVATVNRGDLIAPALPDEYIVSAWEIIPFDETDGQTDADLAGFESWSRYLAAGGSNLAYFEWADGVRGIAAWSTEFVDGPPAESLRRIYVVQRAKLEQRLRAAKIEPIP